MRNKYGFLTLNLLGEFGSTRINSFSDLDKESQSTIRYIYDKYLNNDNRVVDKPIVVNIQCNSVYLNLFGCVYDNAQNGDTLTIGAVSLDSVLPTPSGSYIMVNVPFDTDTPVESISIEVGIGQL